MLDAARRCAAQLCLASVHCLGRHSIATLPPVGRGGSRSGLCASPWLGAARCGAARGASWLGSARRVASWLCPAARSLGLGAPGLAPARGSPRRRAGARDGALTSPRASPWVGAPPGPRRFGGGCWHSTPPDASARSLAPLHLGTCSSATRAASARRLAPHQLSTQLRPAPTGSPRRRLRPPPGPSPPSTHLRSARAPLAEPGLTGKWSSAVAERSRAAGGGGSRARGGRAEAELRRRRAAGADRGAGVDGQVEQCYGGAGWRAEAARVAEVRVLRRSGGDGRWGGAELAEPSRRRRGSASARLREPRPSRRLPPRHLSTWLLNSRFARPCYGEDRVGVTPSQVEGASASRSHPGAPRRAARSPPPCGALPGDSIGPAAERPAARRGPLEEKRGAREPPPHSQECGHGQC